MSVFSNIMEKLGFFKKKAVEAVVEPAKAEEIPQKIEETSEQLAQATQQVAEDAKETAENMVVDVKAVCEELAKKAGSKLNWNSSIVDLLKLLGIDSSLENRKKLAEELQCPKELIGGDYSKMNIWLHKAVMKELAKNGGKVPEDLLN